MNPSVQTEIEQLQQEVTQLQKKIVALRKLLSPEPIADYQLLNSQGALVNLSSLMDERNELMVIHNMGKQCSYCTLWADGLNGFEKPLSNRMPWVLVSPDAPEVQKEFAESRGWQFRMLSSKGTTFFSDLGFEPEPGKYWPGVSAIVRKDGQLFRVGKDFFGPGDNYCSVWHLFNLFPNGANGWHPKIQY